MHPASIKAAQRLLSVSFCVQIFFAHRIYSLSRNHIKRRPMERALVIAVVVFICLVSQCFFCGHTRIMTSYNRSIDGRRPVACCDCHFRKGLCRLLPEDLTDIDIAFQFATFNNTAFINSLDPEVAVS